MSIPFFIQKWTLIFDRFLEPKLDQNGPKMGAKIHPKSIQNLCEFLVEFWIRFWSQKASENGAQNHKKSWENRSRTVSGLKNTIFRKIAPRVGETLILEGPESPKHSQNQAKTIQEPIKNPTKTLIEFWIDFVTILAPIREPFGFPFGTKIA